MEFLLILATNFLLSAANPVQDEFKLLVLHTNDMHSRFAETDVHTASCPEHVKEKGKCYGGFARLKQAVGDARLEAAELDVPSVFLNAGDTFQGTVYYSLFKWRIVAAFISMLGIDVMSLGNHEFDDGVDGLVPYLENISIPVVTANLDFSRVPQLQLPILTPSKILEIRGRRIGIVGYLTSETKSFRKSLFVSKMISSPGHVRFLDEVECVQKEAKRLKEEEQVDIVIALGHSGLETDIDIAKRVPEVSLVVGGHTNSFLHTPKDDPPSIEQPVADYPLMVTQPSGKKVPVVQAYAYTKYLGKLWVTFDENGDVISATGNPLLLTGNMKQDDEVLQKVKKYEEEVGDKIKQIVGETNVFLEGGMKCRVRECNLGNFVVDSYMDAYISDRYEGGAGWTDASVAIIQGGNIRTDIAKGNITFEDVLTMLPFQNDLKKMTVSGQTLREAIEYSVWRYSVGPDGPTEYGEFLQYSGIRVSYDISKPAHKRVSSIKIRCSNCSVPVFVPLRDNHHYSLIISDYLSDGGDGFHMFKHKRIHFEDIGLTSTDAFIMYIKKLSTIYPGVEDRISMGNIRQLPLKSTSSSVQLQCTCIQFAVSFIIFLLFSFQ